MLVADGTPTHLYLAVMAYSEEDLAAADGPADLASHAKWPADARNVCIPLDPPPSE